MSLKSLLTISISLLTVVSCGGNPVVDPLGTPEVVTNWVTFDCGDPPARDKVSFHLITFRIRDGLYTLTGDEYAKLGENTSDMIKGAAQLKNVIKFYENCIQAAQNKAGER